MLTADEITLAKFSAYTLITGILNGMSDDSFQKNHGR